VSDWKYAKDLEEQGNWTPSADLVAEVRRKAEASATAQAQRPSNKRTWMLAPVALAAAALLVWFLFPTDVTPQTGPLVATGWTDGKAHEHVAFTFLGEGKVISPHEIQWSDGELRVHVTPEQGIDLRVMTEEAVIRVVGTMFTVVRNAQGTQVTVDKGQVEVTCSAGSAHQLAAGHEERCPRSAAAALGWAVEELGESGSRVLTIADRGLRLPQEDPAVTAELHMLRARTLLDSEQFPESIAAAEDILSLGETARTADAHHIAARAAVALDDCTTALPHLEALTLSDQSEAVPLVLLADCVVRDEPARALEALKRIDLEQLPEAQRSSVQDRLDRFGNP